MKEAVRTGILSKRWQFLWTSVSTLVFQNRDFIEGGIRKFVSFVDRTLVLCRNGDIKKFAVSFRYKECFASSVNLWIRFATQNHVEDLDLHFNFFRSCRDIYKLPQHLYCNSSLTHLSLWNCNVVPSGDISWSSLKGLSIEYVELSENVIAKIISGCPELEFLKIKGISGTFDQLVINSESLKVLAIENSSDDIVGGYSLEIIAPNLLSLQISGPDHGKETLLINTPSLVNANLDFSCYTPASDVKDDYEKPCNLLRNLLKSLRHVKELKLGTWCIQFVFPTTFIDSYYFDGDNYWKSQKRSFNYLLLHLKTVKIVGLVGHRRKFVLALVQFLLDNAKVLERMVIDARRVWCDGCSRCCTSHDYFKVTKNLLSFPRSSPHAVIVFSESDGETA